MNAFDAPLHPRTRALAVIAVTLLVPLLASPKAFAQGALAALEGATIISRDVVVEPGDTVLSIARRELGSAAFARPLAEFNGLEPGGALLPGDIVRIPIHVPARGETAIVAFVKGEVTRAGVPLEQDALLAEGDVVVTGENGFASIAFSSGSVVNLQPNTTATLLRLSCLESDDSCLIEVSAERGEFKSDVESRDGQPTDFRISTPFASAAVRGTVFETVVGTETLRAAVTEGEIGVEAEGERVELPEGFGSVTRAGEPPGQPQELLPEPVFRNVPTRLAAGDVLSWFALSDAIAYSALLSLDPDGVQTVAEPTVVANSLSIPPDIAGGVYYVSLRGVDSSDLPGRVSDIRISVADVDESIPLVTTAITRDGSDFLVEIVAPPPDAPGFEVQVSTTEDFDDPLSIDAGDTGQAVLRLDADTLYTRARTLVDPFTVSPFGPVTRSDP